MTKVTCPKCGGTEATSVADMCRLTGVSNPGKGQWMCDSCQNFFDGEAIHWYDDEDFSEFSISQLADVILEDWSDDISPHAYPYVTAMMELEDMSDRYGYDSAESIVAYFLSNAEDWNSEIAREVKTELQRRLDKHSPNDDSDAEEESGDEEVPRIGEFDEKDFYKTAVLPEIRRYFGPETATKYFSDPWSSMSESARDASVGRYYRKEFDLVFANELWCYQDMVYLVELSTDSGVPQIKQDVGSVSSWLRTYSELVRKEKQKLERALWGLGTPLALAFILEGGTGMLLLAMLLSGVGAFAVVVYRQDGSQRKVRRLHNRIQRLQEGLDDPGVINLS